MRLIDLIGGEENGLVQGNTARAIDITGLTSDSREVKPGYLFAALPGHAHDGRAYIRDAVDKGAVALLAPAGTRSLLPVAELPALADMPLVEDVEPRKRFAKLAARFFGTQPETVAAVTGTNGKTSVASFARQIWSHAGLDAASLGTLGLTGPGIEEPGALTTPDPARLHGMLARLAQAGVSHLAMEASSHGLEQFRLDGVRVQAAAFTNLTRDHLDYHGTEEAYFAAKSRLFRDILDPDGFAVLNADIPQYAALAGIAARRGQRVLSYGAHGHDIRIVRFRAEGLGQLVTLSINDRAHDVHVPLVGAFQIHNIACALGLAIATGTNTDDTLAAIPYLTGASGRMELIGMRTGGGAVFVDYAHTPDALLSVLQALRPHTTGKLRVVFGCGGDRDRGKRPLMGRIATDTADDVIVTDDNPRTENAAAIRREVMVGAGDSAREVGDRAEAIATAIAELGPGDVLVLAGKGHEQGQIVGDRILPFSDPDLARRILTDLGGGPPK